MKKLDEYKLVIWDLDGTLYYQKEFRLKMARVLIQKLLGTMYLSVRAQEPLLGDQKQISFF